MDAPSLLQLVLRHPHAPSGYGIGGEKRCPSKFLGFGVECFSRKSGGPNQAAQCSLRDDLVVGHGKRRHVVRLDQDNVTASLASDTPAESFEDLHDLTQCCSLKLVRPEPVKG